MTKSETPERFDCVDYKRKVQEEIYAEIRDLTGEGEIEYFRNRAATGRLSTWWKAAPGSRDARAPRDEGTTAGA